MSLSTPFLLTEEEAERLLKILKEGPTSEVTERILADSRRFGLEIAELLYLLNRAYAASENAYCPYSNFPVGAAVLTKEGKYFTGANIENASYPVTTCAERVCLARAVMEGERDFKAVAIFANGIPPGSPCGMCRQFMREFCGDEVPVFMAAKNVVHSVMTLGELLPRSFGPDSMKKG